MKIAATGLTLMVCGMLLAQVAVADGDALRGARLGYNCLGCHGIDGYRNAYPSYRVPRLGGQKVGYLVKALQSYRDGARAHPTMHAQASSLSDEEINHVAAYLSGSEADTPGAGESGGAPIEAAKTCVACHGQNGIGVAPTWPTLAGQHQDYLVHALNQYRDGTRKDPLMSPMAAPLSEDDVASLALFYSGQEGLETTEIE